MTVARGVAFGALLVAVVVVAVVLLTGGTTHKYTMLFQNAGQLVTGDEVQVGGRAIGSVKKIELNNDNQAKVTIEVKGAFAPLKQGTTGRIRQTSLSGVANRYITITPGLNSARDLPDGSTIGAEKTTSPVDLDQLFNTLDPRTLKGLQNVVQGFSDQFKGKGAQANAAAKYFNPALSTTRRVVNELVRDQSAFSALISNGARLTTALAARKDDITNLVTNANKTTSAIGDENTALSQSLATLPTTLRRANSTFVNLRSTLDDLDRLTNVSKPVAPRLAPFFRALRPLVTDARPTIRDLRTLIRRPGANNDLIELLRKAPSLERNARPAFANTIEALRKTTPVLSFIRPYTPDFEGWIRDFGQGASSYDANGHYARIQPIFDTFNFNDNPAGGLLTPADPSQRLAGLSTGNVRRCPGTASQNPADGSAPFRDAATGNGAGSDGKTDCDPRVTIPGP